MPLPSFAEFLLMIVSVVFELVVIVLRAFMVFVMVVVLVFGGLRCRPCRCCLRGWHRMASHDMGWSGTKTWHGMGWSGIVWHGMASYGMAWHDMG